MKIFELEINNLRIQILAYSNSLKNSTFRELQVLIALIFWYNFQFSTLYHNNAQDVVSFFPSFVRFLINEQI